MYPRAPQIIFSAYHRFVQHLEDFNRRAGSQPHPPALRFAQFVQQPAQAPAGSALAGIQGFASGGLVQPASRSLPRPSLPEGTPTRTVRVELSSGQQKVNATVDARDEARLLQLLDAAPARTA